MRRPPIFVQHLSFQPLALHFFYPHALLAGNIVPFARFGSFACKIVLSMRAYSPLSHRLVLLCLICAFSIPARSQRACYWPDGSSTASTNNNFIACNAEGVSHCCNEGEACLSNGLCFGADVGLVCAMRSDYTSIFRNEADKTICRCTEVPAQIRLGKKIPLSVRCSAQVSMRTMDIFLTNTYLQQNIKNMGILDGPTCTCVPTSVYGAVMARDVKKATDRTAR